MKYTVDFQSSAHDDEWLSVSVEADDALLAIAEAVSTVLSADDKWWEESLERQPDAGEKFVPYQVVPDNDEE